MFSWDVSRYRQVETGQDKTSWVEVTFTALDSTTRVEIEHRHLDGTCRLPFGHM